MAAFVAGWLGLPVATRAEPFRYVSGKGAHEVGVMPLVFQSTAKFDITRNGREFKNQPFGRSGAGVALDYFYNLTGIVAVGAEWMYLNRTGAKVPEFWPDSSTQVRGDSSLGLLLLRLRSRPSHPLRAYAIGGAGFHWTLFDLFTAPHGNTPWPDNFGLEERPWIRSRARGFAATARVGIEYAFSDGGLLALEGGFVHMSAGTYASKVPGAAGASNVRVGGSGIMLGARMGLRLGGGS